LFSEAFVKKGWILKNKDIETSHYICLMAHTKLTPQAAYMPMQNKNKFLDVYQAKNRAGNRWK